MHAMSRHRLAPVRLAALLLAALVFALHGVVAAGAMAFAASARDGRTCHRVADAPIHAVVGHHDGVVHATPLQSHEHMSHDASHSIGMSDPAGESDGPDLAGHIPHACCVAIGAALLPDPLRITCDVPPGGQLTAAPAHILAGHTPEGLREPPRTSDHV